VGKKVPYAGDEKKGVPNSMNHPHSLGNIPLAETRLMCRRAQTKRRHIRRDGENREQGQNEEEKKR